MKKSKEKEKSEDDPLLDTEQSDNLVFETKMKDKNSSESRSLIFSFIAFIILFVLWPFLKLFNCKQLWMVYNMAFCTLFIFIGVIMNVFPPAVILYLVIIYSGIVIAEMEAIYHQSDNLSITTLVNDCYAHSESLVFITGGSYTPDNPDSIPFYNILLCLVILIISACANLLYYIAEKKFTVQTYFTFASIVSLCTIFIWKVLEIFYAYKGIERQINLNEDEMSQFFSTYDTKGLLKVVKFFRKASKSWKLAEKLLVPVEFSHTLSLLYLIAIILVKYIVEVDKVASKIGSGDYLVNHLFPNYGFKSILFFLLLIGLIILVIKLQISYSMNGVNENNHKLFSNIKQQLEYLINVPQSFIILSSSADKKHINMTDITINYKDFREAVGTDCPLAKLVWKQIKEEEDLQDVKYRVLREYCSKHSTEYLSRFNIVEKEYLEYYSIIEYKFFGFFEVNKSFMVRACLTLLTALATALTGYIVNHSELKI